MTDAAALAYQGRDVAIHYVPAEPDRAGRAYWLIQAGLEEHPRVVLTDSETEADFILYHQQAWESHLEFPREKLVFVDYSDNPMWIFPIDPIAYFKRAWPYPSSVSRIESLYELPDAPKYILELPRHPATFHPLPYCVLDEFVVEEELERDIDLGCYLRPNQERREIALHLLEQIKIPSLRTHIGPISEGERREFDNAYLHALRRSTIVVTLGPDWTEGDSRTWEALANGALVMQPPMLTPVAHPFVEGEHIVYFDGEDLGKPAKQLAFLDVVLDQLSRPDDAARIGAAGREHALRYHRPVNRVDAILSVVAG
jgi:hypothetical protein